MNKSLALFASVITGVVLCLSGEYFWAASLILVVYSIAVLADAQEPKQ